MNPLAYKFSYRKNLPHIQPPGATLFVTFRLAGSLPRRVLENLWNEAEAINRRLQSIANEQDRERERYREQRLLFGRWDMILDKANTGPHWLKNDAVAGIVAKSLHYRDNKEYELDCFTIMSNHVHVVFTPLEYQNGEYVALPSIMQSLKRFTALKANRLLARRGQFWQHESYDHVVRNDGELQRIRNYILDNPVKAGLVEYWEDWPWTYCKLCQ